MSYAVSRTTPAANNPIPFDPAGDISLTQFNSEQHSMRYSPTINVGLSERFVGRLARDQFSSQERQLEAIRDISMQQFDQQAFYFDVLAERSRESEEHSRFLYEQSNARNDQLIRDMQQSYNRTIEQLNQSH